MKKREHELIQEIVNNIKEAENEGNILNDKERERAVLLAIAKGILIIAATVTEKGTDFL